MLYYNIKDYKDFNELFGINKHGNGKTSRKNAILLSFLKNPKLLKNNEWELLRIRSLDQLRQTLLERILNELYFNERLCHNMNLNNKTFHSSKYSTDCNMGLCEDGDYKSIRYFNHGKDQVFKMKAGKLYLELIMESEFAQNLETNVRTWLVEELARDWQTYAYGKIPANTLHIDDDFDKIYSSYHLKGDFKSCMVDRGRTDFYKESVKAKAAYLTNGEDKVIARCILFTDVKDETGKTWRLAERQYSNNNDLIVQQALVDALIAQGQIDGHKRIGACCGDANAFVDINGKSLEDKKFQIDCDLDMSDILSYQDSFKWYDMENNIAYNYHNANCYYNLDTTDYNLYGDEDEDPYDDYHDYYCDEVRVVYSNGQTFYCDVNNLDDFRYIESLDQYHHYEDVICCDECGSNELEDNAVYSMITGEYYCCEECKEIAEKKYKERNWYFSDFDNNYYPNGEDITTFNRWDRNMKQYVPATIAIDSLDENLKAGVISEVNGNYYFTTELTKSGKLRKEAHHEAA